MGFVLMVERTVDDWLLTLPFVFLLTMSFLYLVRRIYLMRAASWQARLTGWFLVITGSPVLLYIVLHAR